MTAVRVGVVRRGEVVELVTGGEDDEFDLHSINKHLLSMSALLLEGEGRLDLRAPVERYVPSLGRFPALEVGHLLRQTSGLRDYLLLDFLAGHEPFAASWDGLDGLIRRQETLQHDPGARFSYSNTNFVVLGSVLEAASGTPVAELLGQQLFGPLGMTRTAFRGLTPIDVHSTLGDLARFAAAFHHEPLASLLARATDGVEDGYGIGSIIRRHRGVTTIGHSGGAPGHGTMLLHAPQEQTSVVVAVDGSEPDPEVLAYRYLDLVLGLDEPPPDAHEAPGPPPLPTGMFASGHRAVLLAPGDPPTCRYAGLTLPLVPDGAHWSTPDGVLQRIVIEGWDDASVMVALGGAAPVAFSRVDERPPPAQVVCGRFHSTELQATYEVTIADQRPLLTVGATPMPMSHLGGSWFEVPAFAQHGYGLWLQFGDVLHATTYRAEAVRLERMPA